MPVSLNEPVYNDNGDAMYVMDQISDKRNKEDRWVEKLSLQAAMDRLGKREKYIIRLRFFEGKTPDGGSRRNRNLTGTGKPPGKECTQGYATISAK